jgi:WD40 repeat protein
MGSGEGRIAADAQRTQWFRQRDSHHPRLSPCGVGLGRQDPEDWDAVRGQLLRTLEGHNDWVRAVAITPDGRLVVSGSGDETLRIWDAKNGKELCSFEADAKIFCCAVTKNGGTIIAGDGLGQVHFLRLVEADKTKLPIGKNAG